MYNVGTFVFVLYLILSATTSVSVASIYLPVEDSSSSEDESHAETNPRSRQVIAGKLLAAVWCSSVSSANASSGNGVCGDGSRIIYSSLHVSDNCGITIEMHTLAPVVEILMFEVEKNCCS
jgi:hypothetical protein